MDERNRKKIILKQSSTLPNIYLTLNHDPWESLGITMAWHDDNKDFLFETTTIQRTKAMVNMTWP